MTRVERTRNPSWGLFALELGVIAALFAADLRGLVPLSKIPALLLVAWLSLRFRGLRWSDVGWRRPSSWAGALGLGVTCGIAMELLSVFGTQPLLERLFGNPADLSDFLPVVGNSRLLLIYLGLNWSLAAFGEELIFRGYLLPRIAGLLGGAPRAWLAAVLLSNIVFGVHHLNQGLTGQLQAGFDGLLFALLYLATGRRLAVPIIAHGVANTLAFLLIFHGRYPGLF